MEIKTVNKQRAGVVIYGPSGCGKSTHATALAAHYGKTRIVDDWTPGGPLSGDTLALTSVPHQGAIPFHDAMHAAGLTLTPRAVLTAVPSPVRPATVDQLMSATFNRCRDECSPQYQQGTRAVFELRIEGKPIPRRYVAGTAEYDAFHFGIREGHVVWRETQTANSAAA